MWDFMKCECSRMGIYVSLLVFSPLYLVLLKKIARQDTVSILPGVGGIILCIVLLLVILVQFKSLRAWVVSNSSLVNILLIIVTLLFTFSAYYVDRLNSFYKVETALAGADLLNFRYADDFTKDAGGEWIYWTYFLTSPYEQNLDFIGKNLLPICANRYLSVMAEMQILNEINRNTNENSAWLVLESGQQAFAQDVLFKERKTDIKGRAEKIRDDIAGILRDCHGINMEKK